MSQHSLHAKGIHNREQSTPSLPSPFQQRRDERWKTEQRPSPTRHARLQPKIDIWMGIQKSPKHPNLTEETTPNTEIPECKDEGTKPTLFADTPCSLDFAPEMSGSVNRMRSVITTASPAELSTAFRQACKVHGVLDFDVDELGLKPKGRYFSSSHKMLEFHAGIYTINCKSGRKRVLEVNGSQGALFQEFLRKIFGDREMTDLPNFETGVSIFAAYDWSPPLPTPQPGAGTSRFTEEMSEILGNSHVEEKSDDSDATTRDFLEKLVQTMEEGYANEIADAAPTFAVQSEDEIVVRVMRTVGKVVPRLLDLISNHLDACVVRCCVIALSNLLRDDGLPETVPPDEVQGCLMTASERWKYRQRGFVETVFVAKSSTIVRLIDAALMCL